MSYHVVNAIKTVKDIGREFGLDAKDLAILKEYAECENHNTHLRILDGRIKDMSVPNKKGPDGRILDHSILESEITGVNKQNFRLFGYESAGELAVRCTMPKSTFDKRVRKLKARGFIYGFNVMFRNSERAYRRVNLARIEEMQDALPDWELERQTRRKAKRRPIQGGAAFDPAWLPEELGPGNPPDDDERPDQLIVDDDEIL